MLLDMEADSVTASGLEKIDNDGLGSVAQLAEKMRLQQDLVETLESDLKEAKQSLYKIRDEALPAMLAELGLSGLTLKDGSKVTVVNTLGAHIKVDQREEAYQWLRDHEYGDIIKNTVSCQFGRGEDQDAAVFVEELNRQGMAAVQKTEVHAGTLKAWVRERVENGDSFPMDLFGAYVGQQAKIERKK